MCNNRIALCAGSKIGDYTISQEIAQGGSGITYFAKSESEPQNIYIIKEIYPQNSLNILNRRNDVVCYNGIPGEYESVREYLTDLLENEIQNNKEARRKNEYGFVMDRIENRTDESNAINLYAKMETQPGQTIKEFINNDYNYLQGKYFINTLKKAFNIIESLLVSVMNCHEQGILHLDINPSNCYLLDSKLLKRKNETVMLIDYGSSVKQTCKERLSNYSSYSEGFSAPELKDLFFANQRYSFFDSLDDENGKEIYQEHRESLLGLINESTDYYSVGAILYYLMFREFYDGNYNEMIDKVKNTLDKNSISEEISSVIVNIFSKTLCLSPSERYEATEDRKENPFKSDVGKVITALENTLSDDKKISKIKHITMVGVTLITLFVLAFVTYNLCFNMNFQHKITSIINEHKIYEKSAKGALEAYNDKNYEKAIDINKTLIMEDGNTEAIRRLAYLLAHGLGMDEDVEKAAKLYQKAYDLGDDRALSDMLYMYLEKEDWEKVAEISIEGFLNRDDRVILCLSNVYDPGIVENYIIPISEDCVSNYDSSKFERYEYKNYVMYFEISWKLVESDLKSLSALGTYLDDYWYNFISTTEEKDVFHDNDNIKSIVYHYKVYKRNRTGWDSIDIDEFYHY